MSSRSEEILTAISEGIPTDIEPNCRKEQFLKAIANGDATGLPEPTCREEVLLKQIAENGISGGGSTTVSENLDEELAEQDTLLAALESDVNALPDKPVDKLQYKCDTLKTLAHEFRPLSPSTTGMDKHVTEIMRGVDTSNVKYMQYMFATPSTNAQCTAYEDLSGVTINAQSCINMEGMFSYQISLSKPPQIINTNNVTNMHGMFEYCGLSDIPEMNTNSVTNMKWMFRNNRNLTDFIFKYDTSNVTNFSELFNSCSKLQNVDMSNINTDKLTDAQTMFQNCANLISVNLSGWNTSKLTTVQSMFSSCPNLTNINLNGWDTSKIQRFGYMFQNSTGLSVVPELNMLSANMVTNMFNKCTNITNLTLKNIKINLQIGSGTDWGHLLTLDSLLNTIKELHTNTTTNTRTLTVGSANLEKLANVYVKLVDITDDMRAEDEYIDNKLPFEVCESTDEGAMLITTDYLALKNWNIA